MGQELHEAFRGYHETARRILQGWRRASPTNQELRLVVNPTWLLHSSVEALEQRPEFQDLVAATEFAFTGCCSSELDGPCYGAVHNFLRRSGYYTEVFEGKDVDFDGILDRYERSFRSRNKQITFLVPLEPVDFEFPNSSMDFGKFQIRRYKEAELKGLLQNEINEVFYPGSAVALDKLRTYWFIQLSDSCEVIDWESWSIDVESVFRVNLRCTAYPRAVEAVLQRLALYEWHDWGHSGRTDFTKHREDPYGVWQRFKVPFGLEVDDYLLVPPRRAPDTSMLRTVGDPEAGQLLYLPKDTTLHFKGFIDRTEKLLLNLGPSLDKNWMFLRTALCYSVKAFFAEGLEQLLWHITVIEALLGEKGEGVTERLARRLALILAKDQAEMKLIKKSFKDLYEFRSSLVHGRQPKDEIYAGHLRMGRELARRSLLWFLHYLHHIQDTVRQRDGDHPLPDREDILMLLDDSETIRLELGWLSSALPNEFPIARAWVE